jgi:1-acyl-sn-glycerol-3-phosphate acyltransferase
VIRGSLLAFVEALFRVLFSYDCHGDEKLPEAGPAVISANHPSYLDPVLLSLQVKRPIRFMAWDRIFRVPLLGALARLFGAFPVDTRPGRGLDAYERARKLLVAGDLVGIFPEGKRSRAGWMEPELRRGAARLALETGAPLYPATIRGAFRAWPYFRALPAPATIQVRYHDPIDPAAYRALPRDEASDALLAELRRRVERTLLPGVKADAKIEALYRTSAPWPRLYEALPALGLALLVFWKTRALALVWPCYAYIGYLLLDLLAIPQRRLVKWIRNGSAAFFTVGYLNHVLPALGLPVPHGRAALAALLVGAGFPHLYDRGRVALGWVEGVVLASLLALGALYLQPTPLGPHVALPLFCAAYAWEERSVFWRYSVPVLTAYAILVPAWLGGGLELLPHALAGLLAWGLGRLMPPHASTGASTDADDEPGPAASTLGLRD